MSLPTCVVRGTSVDPLNALHRDFDTVLSRLFNGEPSGPVRLASYAVDVREDADHIYVDVDLPGFKKEEIDVTLENQTLTISAERAEAKETKGEYRMKERRYNKFLRSFTLPPTVDEKQVDAKLNDGVLNIVLNKREETKPRKVTVS